MSNKRIRRYAQHIYPHQISKARRMGLTPEAIGNALLVLNHTLPLTMSDDHYRTAYLKMWMRVSARCLAMAQALREGR